MNFAFRISLDYCYFSLISVFAHQYYYSNPSAAFSVSDEGSPQFSLSLVLLKHQSDHMELLFTILQWLPVVSKFLTFLAFNVLDLIPAYFLASFLCELQMVFTGSYISFSNDPSPQFYSSFRN